MVDRRHREPGGPIRLDDALRGVLDGQAKKIERLEQAVRTLNKTDKQQQGQIEGSVRHVALLRYDAFEDVGGRLSFSCAMLDDHGTGVVLTSINGRQETRVYAKPITDGRQQLQPLLGRGRGDPAGARSAGRGGGGAMIFKKDEADETQQDDAEAAMPPRPESGERPQKGKERQMAENGEVTVVGVGARLEGTSSPPGACGSTGR